MAGIISREIRLLQLPQGMPEETDFEIVTSQVPSPAEGEVLVANSFLSVDPYMRGRMRGVKTYTDPFKTGEALTGGAVGIVQESRSPDFSPGDAVLSMYGWREAFTAPAQHVTRLDTRLQPISVALGLLGMPGMTAWVGLKIAQLAPGQVVYVSAAAGAVGIAVGQFARLRGCTVIGSTGMQSKADFLLTECRFDHAFCYRSVGVREALAELAPQGIDLYFDNVGGDTLEAALEAIKTHGVIIACGSISAYNALEPVPGPRNLFYMVTKRLTWRGMLVSDWFHEQPAFLAEAVPAYLSGAIKSHETVYHGIQSAPQAFRGLFTGANTGKMLIAL